MKYKDSCEEWYCYKHITLMLKHEKQTPLSD